MQRKPIRCLRLLSFLDILSDGDPAFCTSRRCSVDLSYLSFHVTLSKRKGTYETCLSFLSHDHRSRANWPSTRGSYPSNDTSEIHQHKGELLCNPNPTKLHPQSVLSTSTCRKRTSTRCAGASPPRAGPARSSSQISRRACRWRLCRSSRATGRQSTTGASARRSSTRYPSSRPRSTGSTSISSTSSRHTRTRCR